MGLTVASFQDYDTFKKDLHLTLRSTVLSDYTFLLGKKNKVQKQYLLCGKFHKAMVNSLKEQFDSFTILGKGTYENTVFHPVSGLLKTSHLQQLGVDKISTVKDDKHDVDMIPGRDITVASFRSQLSSAELLLTKVPFPKWKVKLESLTKDARKQLDVLGTEATDYEVMDKFLDYLPWFGEKLQAGIKLHGQIAELAVVAIRQQKEGQVAFDKASQEKKPDPVAIKTAKAKVERFGQAIERLQAAKKRVENGPDSLTDAAKALNEAKDYFTSVTDFNNVEPTVKSDKSGVKLRETINQADGLSDLYSTIKQRTLQAFKSSSVPDFLRDGYAEVLKIVMKDLFNGDLGSKLEAVEKTADKPIDARKPYIEKAILTTRQYIGKIAELERGDLPVALLSPMRDTLVHIQSELTTLYTSKVLPEQK